MINNIMHHVELACTTACATALRRTYGTAKTDRGPRKTEGKRETTEANEPRLCSVVLTHNNVRPFDPCVVLGKFSRGALIHTQAHILRPHPQALPIRICLEPQQHTNNSCAWDSPLGFLSLFVCRRIRRKMKTKALQYGHLGEKSYSRLVPAYIYIPHEVQPKKPTSCHMHSGSAYT